jgi:ubiquinone/menaquinone biosynthesis C-methylase UbiE
MGASYVYSVNKDYYESPGVPQSYSKRRFLFAPEQQILDDLGGTLKDKPVLDIGIGPGRTIPFLHALTEQYVGLDYSPNMLELARREYPQLALLLCDARRLSFGPDSFDAVFFCWNAIDDAAHDERLAILREIHRVLKTGGHFVFSAHNLEAPRKSAYEYSGLVVSPNPLAAIAQNASRLRRYVFIIINHLRNRAREVHEEQYSIINDQSHGFRLLTYYITRENQVRQLAEMGFDRIQILDQRGAYISASDACEDGWVYYVARKSGNSA